jgi:hypothetical protein
VSGWRGGCLGGPPGHPGSREPWMRDLQVVAERPVEESLALHGAQAAREQPRRDPGNEALGAEHPAEGQCVTGRERVVARERLRTGRPTLDHRTQLAAAGQPEVQGRADALRGERQAMAGRVTGEEDAVLGGVAQGVRNPVALVADGVGAEVGGQPDGRLLDVEAGIEGPHADPQFAVGGEAPAVAGGHVGAVDPDLHVAAGAVGMDLEPAGQERIRWLDVLPGAEHATPAQGIDDQRRADVAAVGVDGLDTTALPEFGASRTRKGIRASRFPVDLCRLEPERPLSGQQSTQRPVIERREGPGQAVADSRIRRVDYQLGERLLEGLLQLERPQPGRRDAARRGLALADLVAIDDHHVGPTAGQLAGDSEPGEACSANQNVAIAIERRALVTALGGSPRH